MNINDANIREKFKDIMLSYIFLHSAEGAVIFVHVYTICIFIILECVCLQYKVQKQVHM